MKMTIGRKIAFPFFVMFLLIVVVAGITYQGFNKVSASLDNMQLEAVKRGNAGNLRFNITQLLMSSNDYVITQKQYYQHEFDRLNLVVDNYYYEFIRLPLTAEEQRLTELIKQDLDSIRAYSAQIFSIANPRQSPKASALMEIMDYRLGTEVNLKTTQIFDGISKRVEEYHRQAVAVKENATNSIFGVTFLSIFISIIVTFLTVRRISKPIVAVAKVADSMAKGNYSHRVVVKTHDEVALLAKSFNKMAESIQQSYSALETSKRFVESIIEAEPECVCVISQDGTLQSINPAGLRMIDADTSEQVVGKSVYHFVLPEHRQAIQNLTERVFMGEVGTLQFEIVGMKDKRRWLETNSVPLYDEAGHIKGNLGITRDITECKRAEEELLKIGTAVEQTADCVIITGKEGIIQYVNSAFTKTFGYSKEEALGKTPRIFKSGLHPPEFYKELWKTILSGEVFTATFINKRKDGELTYEVKTITPIKDKEGHITNFVSTAKEITEQVRAEEAMRKKEEHYKAVIENIFKFVPEGLLVLTESLNLLKQNKAFDNIVQKYAPLLGYTEQELAQKIIDQLGSKIVSGDSKEIHIWKKDQLETGISGRDELIFQFNTARMFLAEEEEEEEASIVVSLLDITERKLAEQEIISQKNKFAQLFENSPVAIALLDDQDKIVHINESFSALFGYFFEEIKGGSLNDIIVPLELNEEAESYSDQTRAGNQINKESYRKKKDGTLVYVHIIGIPIIINEKLVGIYGMYMDMSQRKEAEEKIKKLSQGVEQSPASIIITDFNGNIEYVNKKFKSVTGYSSAEVIGKNIRILKSGENDPKIYENLWSNIKAGKEWRGELINKKKSGDLYWEAVLISPLISNDGNITNFITLKEDITEQKKLMKELIEAKEKAERANKLKDAFIANMSHEIRTPLNGIIGMTSLIKNIYAQHIKEEDEELFYGIDDSSKRIIRTVDMILNYSRLQTGEYPTTPKEIELSSICESLVREYKTAAKVRSLELTFENSCAGTLITADEYSVTHAISNLIDNAIKYTKDGFVKVILYKGNKGEVKLDVKDSGIGISEEYLDHIFEPYKQEEMGYGRAYEGVGLGLSFVKKFLHLNDASISVISKKREGTTFTIKFNKGIKTAVDKATAVKRVDTVEKPEAKEDALILIVEDDELNQKTFKRAVGKKYNTLLADSADEVYEALKKNKVDLILIDISIKGEKNGLELTKELKAAKEYSHIPVIAVTAHAFDKDRQNSLAAGCDDFIPKPITIQLLLDKIAKFV